MAAQNYEECLRRLLLHEGGYTNNRADPGGPTNFGITIADYRRYEMPGATAADVKAMPLAAAKRIYRAKYWDAQKDDQLPAGVDDSVFDYGVNSGIGRSGKVLRRVVGLPADTSVITAEVVAEVNKRDPVAIVNAINDERIRFLQNLKTWPVFGPGWGRRVKEVRAFSLSIAGQPNVPAPAPKPSVPAPGKAKHPEPKSKDVITKGGPVVTGAGGASFWDWIAAHPEISVLIALALIAAGIFAYRFIVARHREKQETPMPNTPVVPELSPA